MDAERLLAEARAWIADDPDPSTREELEQLVAERRVSELAERFQGDLVFGTAGLRGLLGAGRSRMNRLVVARATAGLSQWLLESVPGAADRGLCIGFDGRHQSAEMALDTAEVAMGYGIQVRAFEHPVPTPLVAFAVLHHQAAAGVVITASHNPKQYNGYKVFWSNGAQIIPPHDAEIARRIQGLASWTIPRTTVAAGLEQGIYHNLGSDLDEAYFAAIAETVKHPGQGRDLSIVYSAMHGVGGRYLLDALERAGFERVSAVPEQFEPDPEFPTVRFPNPEEPGALDLALQQARREGANLVLVNDPDADRLAAAANDASGAWTRLSGDEIGCLLADYLLSEDRGGGERCVVSTVVSSSMLGAIATAHGARWVQTLSGHKWIQNRAIELEASGFRCLFCYEEALGYAPTSAVRDKDGIGAALLLADMAAHCHAQGKTLLDARDALAERHGIYVSRQVSLSLEGEEGAAEIRRRMDGLRKGRPRELAGFAVVRVVDLLRSDAPSDEPGPVAPSGTSSIETLPSSDVLVFELEGAFRLALRPSGTEPKLKHYFEAFLRAASGESIAAARRRATARLDELVARFFG